MEKSPEIQEFEALLNQIGWALRHKGAGFFYVCDHEENVLPWYVRSDRLSYDSPVSNRMACEFYFKDVNMEIMEGGGTIAISPKNNEEGSPFVLFHNFTKADH